MTMDLLIYAMCLGLGVLFTSISVVVEYGFSHRDTKVWPLLDPVADHHPDQSRSSPARLSSPTLIASFLMGVGGAGLVSSQIEMTSRIHISLPLAVAGGCLAAWGLPALCRRHFQTEPPIHAPPKSIPDQLTAIVVTTIPESGQGEIACLMDGTRRIVPARTENGMPLAAGRRARVTRMDETIWRVEEID